ncbi:MAG: hypothetical protein AMXMBFR84_12450 [Candidatus Hydrogenedentota bacterium]
MTNAKRPGQVYRRFKPKRWVFVLLVAFGSGVLFWVDDQMKDAPKFNGFHPENASWVLQCGNLPRFWLHAQQTPELQTIATDRPEIFNRFELQTRKLTGIRPSPLRWSIWLGKRMVMAESPEGAGICVYPGLLTRIITSAYQNTIAPNAINGVWRVGGIFYGWREGHLIASNTMLYVQASLNGRRAVAPDRPLTPFEALLSWGDGLTNQLRVAATEGFPFSGHLTDHFTPRTEPLTLTDAWPSSPLFAVTASQWNDMVTAYGQVRGLLSLYDGWTAFESFASLLWREWQLGELPPDWEVDAGISEMTLTILKVDADEMFPVPDGVLVMRTHNPTTGMDHPLKPLVAPIQAIPHEWENQPGDYVPLLGEKLSICLGRNDEDFLAANSEGAMTDALSRLRKGESARADLTFRMNWGAMGTAMAAVLRQTAGYELVPGRNRGEILESIVPQLEAMAPLGELTIVGKAQGERLLFQGTLCRSVESAP